MGPQDEELEGLETIGGFGVEVEEVREPSESVLFRERMSRWVKEDAEGALRWFSDARDSAPSIEAFHEMARLLLAHDSSLALAWGKTLASMPERAGVAIYIAREALRSDPISALGVARELPPSETRDEFLCQALAEWGARDVVAAGNWLREIQDEGMRSRLISSAAVGVATEHPEVAAAWVARELPPGAEQSGAVVSIIQRWTQSEPEKAAEWVATFPEAPIQHAALKALLQSWTSRDPASAMEWVSRLPSGPFKARASHFLRR